MAAQKITVHGNPMELEGSPVNVGDRAPDAKVVANDMSEVAVNSFAGKVRVICPVGSLDTSTCDTETRRFNEEAGRLGDDVHILTISMDLPFAQKRWCGAAGVDKVVTLSDYRSAAFGKAYGVLIKDLRLLARAVFVVDRDGVIRYKQIVEELADEPDYAAALKAVKELV